MIDADTEFDARLTRLFALAAWLGATPARAEPTNMVQPHDPAFPATARTDQPRRLCAQSRGQNGPILHQLRAFREGRRSHKEMLYISRKLTDDDMRALAAYYQACRALNRTTPHVLAPAILLLRPRRLIAPRRIMSR